MQRKGVSMSASKILAEMIQRKEQETKTVVSELEQLSLSPEATLKLKELIESIRRDAQVEVERLQGMIGDLERP